MRKELFVQEPKSARIDDIATISPTGVMLWHSGMDATDLERWRNLGWNVGVAVDASIDKTRCPGIGPTDEELRRIIELRPDTIWLDHLLFPGKWDYDKRSYVESHDECGECHGRERRHVVAELASRWRKAFSGELGFFAVPLGIADSAATASTGQQHSLLVEHFDIVGPMLYHRMTNQPSSFIDEYTRQIAQDTGKPVLPLIQVSDMPDDIVDSMKLADLLDATTRAVRKPSAGVAWFSWEHAIVNEKKSKALRTAANLVGGS